MRVKMNRPKLSSEIAPAYSAARSLLKQRRANCDVSRNSSSAYTASGKRAAAVLTPNRRMFAAMLQYSSGAFSR